RRVEPREILARPAEIGPDHEPVLLLAQELLRLPVLHGLVLERRVSGREDQTVEGRDHHEAVARLVRHAPFGVERVLRDRLGADAQRFGALRGLEREPGGMRDRWPDQQDREQAERRRGPQHAHFVSPTTTRSNVAGGKYLAATRCTSAAVTLPMRSL